MTKYEDYEIRQFQAQLKRCDCENKTYSIVKNTKSVNKFSSRSSFNRMYEEVAYILTDTPIPQKVRVRWLVKCDNCGQASYHELKKDAVNFKTGLEWVLNDK